MKRLKIKRLISFMTCFVFVFTTSTFASAAVADNGVQLMEDENAVYIYNDNGSTSKIVIDGQSIYEFVDDTLACRVNLIRDTSELEVFDYIYPNMDRSAEPAPIISRIKVTTGEYNQNSLLSASGSAQPTGRIALGTLTGTAHGYTSADPTYKLSLGVSTTGTKYGNTHYQTRVGVKTAIFIGEVIVGLAIPSAFGAKLLAKLVSAGLITIVEDKIFSGLSDGVAPNLIATRYDYRTSFTAAADDPLYGKDSFDNPSDLTGSRYVVDDADHAQYSGYIFDEGFVILERSGENALNIFDNLYSYVYYDNIKW